MFEMNFDKLMQNLPAGTITEKKSYAPDERFWKLGRNEQERGTAIIRLLPDKNGVPFIKLFHHSIKKFDPTLGKDRHYIENSPQSIGLPCPASEKWQELMSIGTSDAKAKAKMYNRKVKFMTNILVVKDPQNPQNEGKVFLWEFGTKLNGKFLAAMNPSEEDLALNAKVKELYNPIDGNNILLKIKKSDGFFNYDDTEIMDASSVCDENGVADLIGKTYELNEFMEPSYFGTYDELKIKLDTVINGKQTSVTETPKAKQPEAANESLIEEDVPVKKPAPKKETTSADDELDDLMAELENI